MKKYSITWRLVSHLWLDDEKWNDFLTLIKKGNFCFDSVAFFISDDCYPDLSPLEDKQKQADILKKRLNDLNEFGIDGGINVWPSFNLYGVEQKYFSDFRRMVSQNGTVLEDVACPTSKEFLEYIKEKYKIFARTGSKFIWVDDDCRFTYLSGSEHPCFCEDCVKGFLGGKFSSREELVDALNKKDNKELRVAWSAYGADRLAKFCEAVRSAVDEIDPEIDTPFMTVGSTHTTFAGDYIQKCIYALKSKQARPGHCFYSDRNPFDMMRKMFDVGRQTEVYPDFVEDVLYEEDSEPQTYLNKSVITRINEATLSIMAGCNGIALNHQGYNKGTDLSLLKEVEELSKNRAKWNKILSFQQGLTWSGMWVASSWFLMAKQDCENGWFVRDAFGYDVTTPESIGQLGVALTADSRGAKAVLLSGKIAEIFSDNELKEILSGNVIMDLYALRVIEKRGLGYLCGVKTDGAVAGVCYLSDHNFNNGFEGFRNPIAFGYCKPEKLVPLNNKVEFLGYIASGVEIIKKGDCISKYQNELGGKIIVDSAGPWHLVDDIGRVNLLASIAKWFGCPYIEWENQFMVSRVQPFVKTDGKKALVMLLNTSFDRSYPFQITVGGEMKVATLLKENGEELPLEVIRKNGSLSIKVPEIAPWEIATVFAYYNKL